MGYIAELSVLDRYQASKGIETAADKVAEWAERARLSSVEVKKYPADGERRWWTYRAPVAWTPIAASLSVDGRELAAYPKDPCSIATYSAAIPDTTLRVGSELAITPNSSGALGFVTDAASNEEQTGRIELPHDSRLFGFSVRPAEMRQLAEAQQARVLVEVDRSAFMPVVTGVIPGKTDDELWLQAHLCHARPGANDNLSGVAALLGLASVLADLQADRTIRFLWGPEFVGTAAMLHETSIRPFCVVNLDMVGEDQDKCGGPLTIERTPDHIPSFLSALVEAAAEAIPQGSWAWTATPFKGASDHLLFADRSIARPAVQIGHWPDRFNHSSADTIDKVDPAELVRSSAIEGAAAHVAAMSPPEGKSIPLEPPDQDPLVRKWPGPFNLRALMEDAGKGETRVDLDDYVRMTALALAIDDRSSRLIVIRRASLSSMQPIEPDFAHEFFDTLVSAGWAVDGAGS